MTDPHSVTLGGRIFDVPPLPLRLNMRAYPLCRTLSGGTLLERIANSGGSLDCTEEEMAELAELAFIGAKAADPDLDRATFDELPILPAELINSFFALRYQTGGWVPVSAQEGIDDAGEAEGERKKPRKSTSEVSSQS
jgi:hypothetical protein